MHVYFDYDFLNLSNLQRSGGVYYFFALSGFMVYYLYHKELGNPRQIKNFLLNRFIRIYPIYWILTLTILPIYFVFHNLGTGNERNISHIVASLLLIPDSDNTILSVAWSLEHTVFFYLMFSLAFYKKKSISMLIPFIWASLSYAFSINLLKSSNYFVNFLFNFNNLIFLSGIACAFAVTRIKIKMYLSCLLVILGIAGFPLSWINTQYSIVDIDLQYATTIASIFLILGFASIDLQKDIKIPRLAKFLGDASFSIYLTHFTSMSAISLILSSTSVLPLPNFLIAILLIISSIVVGCLVYVLLEKPITKKLKNFYFGKHHPSHKGKILNWSTR